MFSVFGLITQDSEFCLHVKMNRNLYRLKIQIYIFSFKEDYSVTGLKTSMYNCYLDDNTIPIISRSLTVCFQFPEYDLKPDQIGKFLGERAVLNTKVIIRNGCRCRKDRKATSFFESCTEMYLWVTGGYWIMCRKKERGKRFRK